MQIMHLYLALVDVILTQMVPVIPLILPGFFFSQILWLKYIGENQIWGKSERTRENLELSLDHI